MNFLWVSRTSSRWTTFDGIESTDRGDTIRLVLTSDSTQMLICPRRSTKWMRCRLEDFCEASTNMPSPSKGGMRSLLYNRGTLKILRDARMCWMRSMSNIRSDLCRTTSLRICGSTRRLLARRERGAQVDGRLGDVASRATISRQRHLLGIAVHTTWT